MSPRLTRRVQCIKTVVIHQNVAASAPEWFCPFSIFDKPESRNERRPFRATKIEQGHTFHG